ncbi:putative uncharacterized protein DDB_G0286901 [Montipora foliosa]|uniref:putative uncharacterized protein DDB_G0286901 n=1 Tax=Montipora foliosa TaxID=591990 RepID=UPI0035F1EDA6
MTRHLFLTASLIPDERNINSLINHVNQDNSFGRNSDYNPNMTRFTSATNNNDDYHSDCTSSLILDERNINNLINHVNQDNSFGRNSDYNPNMTRFTSATNNNDDYHSDCTSSLIPDERNINNSINHVNQNNSFGRNSAKRQQVTCGTITGKYFIIIISTI